MGIIGNKETFAIEYILSNITNMGNVRIWTDNKYIGAIEDNIFLDTFYNSFNGIEDLSNNNFIKNAITKNIKSNPSFFLNTSKFNGLISLPENFDDFITRIFEFNNGIYFFWKIVKKPYFIYEEYDVQKTFFSIVRKEIVSSVVNEFINTVRKNNASN